MKRFLLLVGYLTFFSPTSYSQTSAGYRTIAHDSTSFAAIAASFNGADIVGLGESAHGSKEMARFKTAFIKHLMQYTSYRVLVMEDHFYECTQINRYLLTGEGEPQEVYSQVRGIWRSPDFLELLQWMRHYNSTQTSEAQKLRIYGVDMQKATAIPHLLAYLSTQGADIPDANRALLQKLNSKDFNILKLPRETQKELKNSLTLAEAALQDIGKKAPAIATSEEYKLMLKQLNIVRQYYENETAGLLKWSTFRDKKMAENIGWIRKQEQVRGNKLLVWAHNGHLNNVSMRMGSYLKKNQPDYFILGQDFISGSTNAIYQKQQYFTYSVQEEPHLLANYFINKAGDTFYIDFTSPGFHKADLHRYLQKHPLLHDEGAQKNIRKIKDGKQFDALLIHRTTSPKW